MQTRLKIPFQSERLLQEIQRPQQGSPLDASSQTSKLRREPNHQQPQESDIINCICFCYFLPFITCFKLVIGSRVFRIRPTCICTGFSGFSGLDLLEKGYIREQVEDDVRGETRQIHLHVSRLVETSEVVQKGENILRNKTYICEKRDELSFAMGKEHIK